MFNAGAEPDFLRKDVLHVFLTNQMKNRYLPDIREANKGPLKLLGTINLTVQLASYHVKDNFFVCKSLEMTIILRTEFCDKFVLAIRPYDKAVKLEDGTTVRVLRSHSPAQRRAQQIKPGTSCDQDHDEKTPSILIGATVLVDIPAMS